MININESLLLTVPINQKTKFMMKNVKVFYNSIIKRCKRENSNS